MTWDLESVIKEVDTAIASAGAVRRETMLGDLVALFAAEADQLTDGPAAAIDAILVRLAHFVGTEARARLSRSLAARANALPLIVRHLAFDAAAEVAGPILERTAFLSDADLEHLARWRDQDHLLALARRRALGSAMTDLLLGRGDRRVLRAVARNAKARISGRGFVTLIGRCKSDPVLLAALERRGDVPPLHRKRLIVLTEEWADLRLDLEFGPEAQRAAMDAPADAAPEKPRRSFSPRHRPPAARGSGRAGVAA